MCELRCRGVSIGQIGYRAQSVLQRQPWVQWRWWIAESRLLFLGGIQLCELIVEAVKERVSVVMKIQSKYVVLEKTKVDWI